MSKEIDINNEEEILKECDFDYFYESEDCSHELCMFYNDIQHQNTDFNCKQAHIDLGRIAITLNKQSQRIAELEAKLAEKEKELHYKIAECEKWKTDYENCSKLEKTMTKERQYCLDNWRASEQDKISFVVEQLEKVKEYIHGKYLDETWHNKIVDEDREDTHDFIDNQIEELKKEMK